MTGYESKRAAARDKLEQWDTPREAFNAWWNGGYDDSTNPFTKYSLAYWAFAGWQAALAQPEQEQKPMHPQLKAMLEEYFDKCFAESSTQPAQEPWRESASDYERGVIDGRQMQAQSSVDKAVNAMTQRPWVGLEGEEIRYLWEEATKPDRSTMNMVTSFARAIEAKLKKKNT